MPLFEVLAAFAVSKHQAPSVALAGPIDSSAAIRTNGTLSSQEEITSETASSSHEEFGPNAELTADELNPVTTVDPEHHETKAILANTNAATLTGPKFGVHPVLDKWLLQQSRRTDDVMPPTENTWRDLIVRPSQVHGRGLFATRTFLPGEKVALAYKIDSLNAVNPLLRSEPARFTNHSTDAPNVECQAIGDEVFMIAGPHGVPAHAEVLVDYTNCSRAAMTQAQRKLLLPTTLLSEATHASPAVMDTPCAATRVRLATSITGAPTPVLSTEPAPCPYAAAAAALRTTITPSGHAVTTATPLTMPYVSPLSTTYVSNYTHPTRLGKVPETSTFVSELPYTRPLLPPLAVSDYHYPVAPALTLSRSELPTGLPAVHTPLASYGHWADHPLSLSDTGLPAVHTPLTHYGRWATAAATLPVTYGTSAAVHRPLTYRDYFL